MSQVATTTPQHITTAACQVQAITSPSVNTFEVTLKAPEGSTLKYQAGQYLQLEIDVNGDGKPLSLSYSIANRFDPAQPGYLQLFIQASGELSQKLLATLAQYRENQTPLKVTLPMGSAFLQTDLNANHVLVAAGSGIAKIRCITQEILTQQPDAKVSIYWSNKKQQDFYLLDEFRLWEEQHQNLCFTPILESPDTDWSGRAGYIYKVLEEDFEDLKGTQAYLCGSPQMVYGTLDQLKPNGLEEANCYSDVFEYAPREQKVAV